MPLDINDLEFCRKGPEVVLVYDFPLAFGNGFRVLVKTRVFYFKIGYMQ